MRVGGGEDTLLKEETFNAKLVTKDFGKLTISKIKYVI